MIFEQKKQIRQKILKIRDNLSEEYILQAGQIIADKFIAEVASHIPITAFSTITRHPWQTAIGRADRGYQEHNLRISPISDSVLVRDDVRNGITAIIAGYYPFESELNILPLLKKLINDKFLIALPVIQGSSHNLKFFPWTPEMEMHPSKEFSKIFEPEICEQEYIPDILIIPLLACDHEGNRLGYGKAMYDNAISKLRAINPNILCIGLCYSFQLINLVPTENHDQKLDIIITENNVIKLTRLCEASSSNEVRTRGSN